MSLDNTRNRTLQLNLAISVASFALMASTVPASFFGMNLHSGMEVGLCTVLPALRPIPSQVSAGNELTCTTALQRLQGGCRELVRDASRVCNCSIRFASESMAEGSCCRMDRTTSTCCSTMLAAATTIPVSVSEGSRCLGTQDNPHLLFYVTGGCNRSVSVFEGSRVDI
jgi:hypothetical protein